MKLEKGLYVRTKKGEIFKTDGDLIYLNNDKTILYRLITRIPHDTISYEVVKVNSYIIDILECGDYVNGQIVTQIIPNNRKKEPSTMVYTGINYFVGLYNGEIKSIVTHEQMEQMSYKLGE